VSHDPTPTPAHADFTTHSQGIFVGWLGLGMLAFAVLFALVVIASGASMGFS
jgi:hypothetical protein